MDTSLLDTNLQSQLNASSNPNQRIADISQGPSASQTGETLQDGLASIPVQDIAMQAPVAPPAPAAPLQDSTQNVITQPQPKMKILPIAGGAAAGALIGHYLIKKGNTWTIGLAVVGAIAGWYFTKNQA